MVVTLTTVLQRVLLFEAEMESISSTEHAHCFEFEGKLLKTFEVFSVKMIASQRPTCQKKKKKKKKLRVRCVPCASVLLQPSELSDTFLFYF